MATGIGLLIGGVLVRLIAFGVGRAARPNDASRFSSSTEDLVMEASGRVPSWKAQGIPAWARVIGNLGYLAAAIGIVMIIVSLVSDDDDASPTSEDWTSEDRETFRREFCGEVLRVDEQGELCDCVTAATEQVYPDASDFYGSDVPSIELESAWRRCGVGRT